MRKTLQQQQQIQIQRQDKKKTEEKWKNKYRAYILINCVAINLTKLFIVLNWLLVFL